MTSQALNLLMVYENEMKKGPIIKYVKSYMKS